MKIQKMRTSRNGLLGIGDETLLIHHIRNGGVAVLPTDTGHMLSVDAMSEVAVEKLFEIKARSISHPVHVAVGSCSIAEDLVEMTASGRSLFDSLLPGPLTIILPKQPVISDKLVAYTGNLGVRIPDSPSIRSLLLAGQLAVTATSVNISGQAPLASIEETVESLNWMDPAELVYIVDDPWLKLYDRPSTVVTLAEEPWTILREGPVSHQAIDAALANLSPADRDRCA